MKSIKQSCNDNYWSNPPTYRITLERNCAQGRKKLLIYCEKFVKVHQEQRAQRKLWKEFSTIFYLNCTSFIKLKFCNFFWSCTFHAILNGLPNQNIFSGIFKISSVKKMLFVSSTTKENCLLCFGTCFLCFGSTWAKYVLLWNVIITWFKTIYKALSVFKTHVIS